MSKTLTTIDCPSSSYMGGYTTNVYVRGGDSSAVSMGMHGINPLSEIDTTHLKEEDELSDNNTVWPRGLVNVGNTCYANAALQCLLSTALANALLDPTTVRVFRRYSSNPNILAQGSGSVDSEDEDPIQDVNDKSTAEERKAQRKKLRRERRQREKEQRRMQKTCQWLTRELRQITLEYTDPSKPPPSSSRSLRLLEWLAGPDTSGNVVDPGSITRHPDHLSKCLRPYCQEDAHEFLRALLSTLVMNGHNKQLSSLFDGLLESSVTCQTCRRPSLTRDRYMDLSLDICSAKVETLTDALQEFTKTELLTGENKVFCQRCKAKRTATKGLRLATAPSILVCHLKRFAFDEYGRLVRLHKCIKFPLQLEIGDFMSRVNKARPPPYELVGVLVHQGRTCDSGHYLAYVKSNGRWFKCNDSEVTKVDVETVLKQQAYILMYEVADMRSKKNGTTSPALQRQEDRQKQKSRSRSQPKHRPASILSYLCSVEVLDNSFLQDLCFEPTSTGSVSGKDHYSPCSKAANYYKDNVGVELVASLRDKDDYTVGDSTVGESTIGESTVESRDDGNGVNNNVNINNEKTSHHSFRKSSSSTNLVRDRIVQQNKLDEQLNTNICSTSDPGADNFVSPSTAARLANQIPRRRKAELPPKPTDQSQRSIRSSSASRSSRSSPRPPRSVTPLRSMSMSTPTNRERNRDKDKKRGKNFDISPSNSYEGRPLDPAVDKEMIAEKVTIMRSSTDNARTFSELHDTTFVAADDKTYSSVEL